MRALFPKLTVMISAALAAAVLSACVALAPAGDKAKRPNPVTGGEIEVTSLDDPAETPAKGKGAKAGEKPGATDALPVIDPGAESVAPDAPTTKPKPRQDAAPEAAVEPEVPATPTPADVVPGKAKTPAQVACEKKRGHVWSKAGTSGASACIKLTRDSGKRCTAGGDCEGECLARSGTCAPYTPLFGCNEILQDNGSRVTLCLD